MRLKLITRNFRLLGQFSVAEIALVIAIVNIFVIGFTSGAFAMPTPMQVKPGRISGPIQSGVFIGGQAQDEFSLLSVRNDSASGTLGERVILNFGDRFGAPYKGEPGFFHVVLDRNAQRVVIDLAQMRKTAVDGKKLAQILSKSKNISSSDISMDPFDGSTNITLTMKQPIHIKIGTGGVTEVKSELDNARLVIDISPIRGGP